MSASFYLVSLKNGDKAVSLITGAYFAELQSEMPGFYKSFVFTPFESPLTFTELNERLPLWVSTGASAPREELSESEERHLRAHRGILDVYRKFALSPRPPWVHIKESPQASGELETLMKELSEAL